MKIGVLTALYHDLPLEQALDRVAAMGVRAVELGTGNYPGNAHCDPDALLADRGRADALRRAVEERGLTISALSQHGNPLHPDPEVAGAAHETWRKTAQLAEVLGVSVVNGFSGCPGDGPDGRQPNWVTCAWPPEFPEILRWQWEERAVPYWQAEAAYARQHGVRIAFEMHPGFLVYNPETLLRLREATGPEIGCNFDPSHLFWQGIDPIAALRELGSAGAIFHVHAKDTAVDDANVRVNGVLDTKHYGDVLGRAWTFRTVGYGHGEGFWRRFVSTLRAIGYDDVVSIEHEDALLSVDEGLRRAVDLLRGVTPDEPPAAMWWA